MVLWHGLSQLFPNNLSTSLRGIYTTNDFCVI
jgi:hypothetical protein